MIDAGEIIVLRYQISKQLIGIFSTEAKARIAAFNRLESITDKPIFADETGYPSEIFFSDGNVENCLVAEKWTIDKALINNEWIVL